ncbi:MAG: hypothetical protein SFV23_18930 [Planctomycetaceae bacterium]|nr:hypothetical protein [Planctomycetaceae bacterium]
MPRRVHRSTAVWIAGVIQFWSAVVLSQDAAPLPAPAVTPPTAVPRPNVNELGTLPNQYFRTPPPPRTIADRMFGGPAGRTTRTLAPSLLSTPSMFSDMTAGGCGEAAFLAGTVTAGFEHPTFNCTRANLAENNSPLPRDRVYARYNHFHNINDVDIFGETFPDGVNQLHIDRVTFGFEKTFLDERWSLEARVPIARQLTSDVVLMDVQGDYNLPLDDYRTEILNLQFILKGLLIEQRTFAVSGGLAVNVPTAQDFNLRIFVDDDDFEIILPGVGEVGSIAVDADVRGLIQNSTVNLSPFLAYLWEPRRRVFTQGFVQLDVPLNTSGSVVSGTIGPAGPDQIIIPPDAGALHQQTLMRINIGAGYWIWQRPERSFLQAVAGILELHYTTTLNDADVNPFTIPVLALPGPLPDLNASVNVGNLANRVDVLNMTVGTHWQLWPRTSLGVGAVVPLRQSEGDKPFDFELNVLLNHLL